MSDPHKERRTRWLDGAEVLEFNSQTWIEESYVHALMDREMALERKRNAGLLCVHCRDSKPFRDKDTNTFMHQIYIETSPTVKHLDTTICYADLLWRNEDQ